MSKLIQRWSVLPPYAQQRKLIFRWTLPSLFTYTQPTGNSISTIIIFKSFYTLKPFTKHASSTARYDALLPGHATTATYVFCTSGDVFILHHGSPARSGTELPVPTIIRRYANHEIWERWPYFLLHELLSRSYLLADHPGRPFLQSFERRFLAIGKRAIWGISRAILFTCDIPVSRVWSTNVEDWNGNRASARTRTSNHSRDIWHSTT